MSDRGRQPDDASAGAGRDIYQPAENIDPDTLANLGPLRPLAGVWSGTGGVDVNPGPEGKRTSPFEEVIELQPIDPQSNGPQLLYGLRYTSHMTKPGEVGTYHGQVGYWLWEPATELLIHSFTIPRGQVVLAQGRAAVDATRFDVHAERGTTGNGICSSDFLEEAFRTEAFHMEVTTHANGDWSYFQETLIQIQGREEIFRHTDSNVLVRVGEPTPNPLAR